MPGPGFKQKKKMVIKSYKVQPKLPENYLDDTWKQLATAVGAVHRAEPMPVGFETLYKAVEGLCVHRLGGELYDRLESACDSHVDSLMAGLVRPHAVCRCVRRAGLPSHRLLVLPRSVATRTVWRSSRTWTTPGRSTATRCT